MLVENTNIGIDENTNIGIVANTIFECVFTFEFYV